MLNERGYRPFEMSTVMFLPLAERGVRKVPNEGIRVRVVKDDAEDRELFVRTFAEGWSEFTEYAEFMLEMARISAITEGNVPFIAELDGQGKFVADVDESEDEDVSEMPKPDALTVTEA